VDGLILREVIDARRRMAEGKPRSREQATLSASTVVHDTAAFVEAITRRR
jgi:hypothetical protein